MMAPEDSYSRFLARKVAHVPRVGIEADAFPAFMKPHQADATTMALRIGRAGLFLDTGLGKTACELEFAEQTCRDTNLPSLILAPLAVAKQHAREAKKFGYEISVLRSMADVRKGINICNYDRLDTIDTSRFGSVVLDESSILKAFSGATSRALRDAFRRFRFRLAASATPAPNDHMELGQHAEFLGIMSGSEMLSRFFINDTSEASQVWRLKGHAERAFWDWMASWSCMAESPADFGHDASGYVLPKLETFSHRTKSPAFAKDGLFAADLSATNLHEVKRATLDARADLIASKEASEPFEPWVIWCDTNYESDALMARLPKDTVEVRGDMSIEEKEEKLEAFALGHARNIVTKPSIAGFGLNWQHAARMAFIGRSFSYETYYQAVRRCWRFGQTRKVNVHLAIAEGEDQIGRVITRKSADHARMRAMMAAAMQRALGRSVVTNAPYDPRHIAGVPQWLTA